MKKTIILFGVILPFLCYSQADLLDQLNLEKYWKFRNIFREQFVKIGPMAGESLPTEK